MYILKNAFGIFLALGVGVPANEAGLSGNQPPILGKSVTDFWEMRHRFWEMRHRFWGNPSPILRKSITDFGEIRHRFWEAPLLGKTGSVFGKNMVPTPSVGKTPSLCLGKLREKPARFGGRLARFLDWLGTKLKSHCFER